MLARLWQQVGLVFFSVLNNSILSRMKLSFSGYFFLLFLTCARGRALRICDRDVQLQKSPKEKTLAGWSSDPLGDIFKRGVATSLKSEDIPKVGSRQGERGFSLLLFLFANLVLISGAEEKVLSGQQRPQPRFSLCRRPLPYWHQTH